MIESEKDKIKEEIKKEFQLERMILFSDAVFAIVITLMAIEIHLPEPVKGYSLTQDELIHSLLHLLPTVFAYIASFFFIGVLWSQHLKIFGLLKQYDQGLVFRNLLLLFFTGLFPFGAAVISHGPKGSLITLIIYFSLITCSLGALTLIEHYIFFTKPGLRNDDDVTDFLAKHRQRKTSVIAFIAVIILISISSQYAGNTGDNFFPMMWFMLIPLSMVVAKKRTKKKSKA